MSKETIKSILRENLFDRLKETNKTPKTEETKSPSNEPAKGTEEKKDTKNYQNDYAEITRKLDGTLLKASQVMQAAGLGNADDSTARSLFSKKLRQEKNDEGGTYRFDEKELASLVKVVSNPAAYLGTKKK